jgi:hypothetical protein
MKHHININYYKKINKIFKKEKLREKIAEAEAKFDTNQCDLQYLDLCRRSNLELKERIHKLVKAF